MSQPKPMLSSDAVANAVRLLEAVEAETDRTLMEQLLRTAEIWVAVANYLRDDE